MRRFEALAAVMIALLLGLVIILALGGAGLLNLRSSSTPQALHTSNLTPINGTSNGIPTPTISNSGLITPTSSTTGVSLSPTPTGPQLQEAIPIKAEPASVLLLFDPKRPTSFSANFCQLAVFYGLVCKTFARDQSAISRADLIDNREQFFRLIAIDAALIDQRVAGLTEPELELLSGAVNEGAHLLIGKLNEQVNPVMVSQLTGGAISGVTRPEDSVKDWIVSLDLPDITRQLTGQTIETSQTASPDTYALSIADPAFVTPLITSKNDAGETYAIFVRVKRSTSAGTIFLDAGETSPPPDAIALREVYYSAAAFTQITPIMMVLRYSLGDKTWHSTHNFANLTIDEAELIDPYYAVNFTVLLELMKRDNFHTTVAVIPAAWQYPDPQVVAMFLTNPTYFSLVQYGNNGKGYEFYRYEAPKGDENPSSLLTFSSLEQQEQAIRESMARLHLLYDLTRLPIDPIMVFPGGISPAPTLLLLKKNNYLATTNSMDVPLDSIRPATWDYAMYPAVDDYASFPNLIRRVPGDIQAYRPALLTSLLDLFIGKPALFSTSPFSGGIFSAGMDIFNKTARELNRLPGSVEWRSLGYIAQHLYLEKSNDDGSRSIRMYTRQLSLSNVTEIEQIIQVLYPETQDVPIYKLTVNGYEFPYQVKDGLLNLNFILPPKTDAEIIIEYR